MSSALLILVVGNNCNKREFANVHVSEGIIVTLLTWFR